MVEQAIVNSTVKFPPFLVEDRVQDMVNELLEDLKTREVTLEDHMASIGKTKEQLLGEYHVEAERWVAMSLVLRQIVIDEGLDITEADVDVEISRRAAARNTSGPALRAVMEREGRIDILRNQLQTQIVLDFLRDAAIIKDKTVTLGQLQEARDAAAAAAS